MEFFNTKWTRYFQLSCSLLGCETNQLLFLSQLVTHRLHGPPADKFPLFSRGLGGVVEFSNSCFVKPLNESGRKTIALVYYCK